MSTPVQRAAHCTCSGEWGYRKCVDSTVEHWKRMLYPTKMYSKNKFQQNGGYIL